MSVLSIIRGDDYTAARRLTVLVTDPDNADAPVDLTGTALAFMVKLRPVDADDDALISKATGGDGITLANQTTDPGEALIAIAAADTDALAAGLFWWELQGTDGTGVITLASGRFAIGADLIREA